MARGSGGRAAEAAASPRELPRATRQAATLVNAPPSVTFAEGTGVVLAKTGRAGGAEAAAVADAVAIAHVALPVCGDAATAAAAEAGYEVASYYVPARGRVQRLSVCSSPHIAGAEVSGAADVSTASACPRACPAAGAAAETLQPPHSHTRLVADVPGAAAAPGAISAAFSTPAAPAAPSIPAAALPSAAAWIPAPAAGPTAAPGEERRAAAVSCSGASVSAPGAARAVSAGVCSPVAAAAAAEGAAAGGEGGAPAGGETTPGWVVKTIAKRRRGASDCLQAAAARAAVRPSSSTAGAAPCSPSCQQGSSSRAAKKATAGAGTSLPLVEAGKYEGGFSIWEATWDLLQYMLQQLPPAGAAEDTAAGGDGPHVLDLGCGHGLAGLLMLLKGKAAAVALQDYNTEVLLEVTAPTLALNYRCIHQATSSDTVLSSGGPSPAAGRRHRLRVCRSDPSGARAARWCAFPAAPHAVSGVSDAYPAAAGESSPSAGSAAAASSRSSSASSGCAVREISGVAVHQPQIRDDQRQQDEQGRLTPGTADVASLLPKGLHFPENCLLLPCSWSEFPRVCCSCCCSCGGADEPAADSQPRQNAAPAANSGSSCSREQKKQLTFDWILASECLYRPSCFPALYQILRDLLSPETGRAVFAAKRFYFGLNGGTLPFKHFIEEAEKQRCGLSRAAAASHYSTLSCGCHHAFTSTACDKTQPVANSSSRSEKNTVERTASNGVDRRCKCNDCNAEHITQTPDTDTKLHVEVAQTIEDGGSNVRDILVICKRRCPANWFL